MAGLLSKFDLNNFGQMGPITTPIQQQRPKSFITPMLIEKIKNFITPINQQVVEPFVHPGEVYKPGVMSFFQNPPQGSNQPDFIDKELAQADIEKGLPPPTDTSSKTIPLDVVIKILNEHGLNPDTLTLWDPKIQQYIPGSSFYDEFGENNSYDQKKIYDWLGY